MPKVTNQSTGVSADCQAGESMRKVAQEQNLGIPFGCQDGICSTCLIQIKSGAANLGPKTEQEEFTLESRGIAADDMNTRLACQCQVNGDVEFGQ